MTAHAGGSEYGSVAAEVPPREVPPRRSWGGRTALVYPIQLNDRLELLVTLPTGLVRRTVPVSTEAMSAKVLEALTELRPGRVVTVSA